MTTPCVSPVSRRGVWHTPAQRRHTTPTPLLPETYLTYQRVITVNVGEGLVPSRTHALADPLTVAGPAGNAPP